MFRLQFLKPISTPPGIEKGFAAIGGLRVDYSVKRQARRSKIALFVEPTGRLRFVAPLRTRTATIDKFLQSSSQWVLHKLQETQKNPAPHFPAQFTEGSVFYFKGEGYPLAITPHQKVCGIMDGRLVPPTPDYRLPPDTKNEEIRLDIILWYKKQARLYLTARSQFWCDQMGLHYRSLKITSPTRQWGSCTAQNDIRLNWRVLMAPPEIIDYLIVHELAHIRHKHHRKLFWDLVQYYIPDYKLRQQFLKRMDAGATL
jgi:predicted metal-dependent hydrolase